MAKEPGRRYAGALELADDLRRFLKGEPIQARPVTKVERLVRWCRRNPVVASLTAAVVLLLVTAVVVLAVSNYRITRETKEKDLALREKDAALGERDTALVEAKANFAESKKQEKLAQDNEAEAKKQGKLAVERQKLAEQQERLARLRFYASQINLANQAWEAGQPARVLELLEALRPKPGQEDLRTFEWYYLWRLCHRGLRVTLRGQGAFRSVAFSPDGKTLAAGSDDGFVWLWDVATGRELRHVGSGRVNVWAVAFSPDGKTIASGETDGAVNLWNPNTGKKQRSLTADHGYIRSVSFSPDGRTLATISENDTVMLWDIVSNKKPITVKLKDTAPMGLWRRLVAIPFK